MATRRGVCLSRSSKTANPNRAGVPAVHIAEPVDPAAEGTENKKVNVRSVCQRKHLAGLLAQCGQQRPHLVRLRLQNSEPERHLPTFCNNHWVNVADINMRVPCGWGNVAVKFG